MCASTFPWPFFYTSRFSLPKEELMHVPLPFLPSGHTFFSSFVLWILKVFCSHPALTFILAVTSSCFMHLPWSFFLNPFQHQQQKIMISFHRVKSLKKFSFFFFFLSLAAPVLSICYLVCFSLFFYFMVQYFELFKTKRKKIKLFHNQLGKINLLYGFHEFTKITD